MVLDSGELLGELGEEALVVVDAATDLGELIHLVGKTKGLAVDEHPLAGPEVPHYMTKPGEKVPQPDRKGEHNQAFKPGACWVRSECRPTLIKRKSPYRP